MKKLLTFMVCVILVFNALSVMASAESAVASKEYAMIVTNDDMDVPLHITADAGSAIVERYRMGTSVKLLSKEANGWQQVEIGGTKGYVESKYVNVENTASEKKTGIVSASADAVNIRAKESQDSGIAGRVANGATVTILKESDGWCYVEVDGVRGYVLSKYLKVN